MVSRLLVIDGHSLAFRAFFALPEDGFSTSSGQPTNAVYGFTTMLSQVLKEIKPTHIAVAFDVKGGTFRNDLLTQYKGTRDAAPEELLSQLPLLHDLLDSLDISYVEQQGFEGDDIIATLATMARDHGFDHAYVLSGDRDAFQLIDETITVLYPGHHFKDLKHMTPQAVFEKYKVYPEQYPDLAALRGETADNIPGVPGVGDGFAAKWINTYGGLDGIIAHADEIKGKKGDALRENIEQVQLNRKVNALVRDVDLNISLDDFVIHQPDAHKVDVALGAFEFGVNIKRRIFNALSQCAGAPEAEGATITFSAARRESTSSSAASNAEDMSQEVSGNEQTLFEHMNVVRVIDEHTEDTDILDALDQWRSSVADSEWALYVEGNAQPENLKVQRLTLASRQAATVSLPSHALDSLSVRDALQSIFNEHGSQAVMHGYKAYLHMIDSLGMTMPQPLLDTELAAYLLKPDADDYSLATLLRQDAHIDDEDIATLEPQEVQGAFDFDSEDPINEISAEDLARQSSYNALALLALYDVYMPTLTEREQVSLLHEIELPVSEVLFAMEKTGAAIDHERLRTMLETFTADAQQAQNIAWEQAGENINLQSPKQLQAVLFDDMGLPPTKKTKTGGYTTNAAALQDLYVRSMNNDRAHTFLGALLRHREMNKLKQIVQSLTDAIDPRDGHIHSTFEQTVAATGRLSSTDPNLQNIPNRNAAGREIRAAFVPSQGFEYLLSADYSQVELRLMAHLSGDQGLIEAFRSGADFHRYVASLVYGIPVDEITGDQRSHIKAMSYGLAYGLSTYGLAQQLKISPAESDILKNKYFDTFGGVHDYLESLVALAKRKGYTETMFGRRRYFPGLRSSNRQVRDAAERGALNAPIQGSAADIMKLAMIKADKALQEAGVRSRVTMQIHDELVVEVAPGEDQIVPSLVQDAMEHAVELAVPLDVSTGLGVDWQQAAH
ncbi:DNA polymerase I [Alloscardovia omnicolens]|uniref:DNA polymerase I n=1 Tax=Alloscardovia omnicolens TaxID=419015 RepID=UPI003A6925F3